MEPIYVYNVIHPANSKCLNSKAVANKELPHLYHLNSPFIRRIPNSTFSNDILQIHKKIDQHLRNMIMKRPVNADYINLMKIFSQKYGLPLTGINMSKKREILEWFNEHWETLHSEFENK